MKVIMKKEWSSIKGILWDLDNTLYHLDTAMEDSFNLAIARAVIEYGGRNLA